MHGYGTGTSLPAFGPAVLRLALAAVFIFHGAQKLFGLWGGAGLAGTAAAFSQAGVEPAYPLAAVWGVVQFGAGLLLVVGAFTTVSSIALAVLMIGGLWKALAPGQDQMVEYYVVMLAALVCLMLTGPGAFSIDRRRAAFAEAEAAGRARLRAGKV